jgi:predicted transcriptional regulator
MSGTSGEHRESLWLHIPDDLLGQLDALAKARGVTRHDIARLALRLGTEAMRGVRRDPR